MTFDGYTRVEYIPFGSIVSALWIDNSIDTTVTNNCYEDSTMIIGRSCSEAGLLDGDRLYCQNEDDSDADNDYKLMNTTASNGPVAEYSSTSTSTPIYEAITNSSPFGSNQDLSKHNVKWKVSHQSKVANVPVGETAFMQFKFYKVDSSDNETLLFTIEDSVGTFYGVSTAEGFPSGSVTTSDRLCMKVFHTSRTPS